MSDEGALAYQKAPVDVINVLEVASGAFRERFASRNLKIDLSLPDSAVVFGDKDRLMQLFNNLLENSLRYTDSGGGLHISGRQDNGRFALTFADSAPACRTRNWKNCSSAFTAPKAPAIAPAAAPAWG